MAPGISRPATFYLLLLLSALSTFAAVVEYDFNITWVTRNPDNAFDRTTIGINGQWPVPEIRVNKGDRLIVNVNNQLGNQSTTLHFHGLYQNGTSNYDGVPGATQCPIPPGSSMKYNFTVDQAGTYWYHSHQKGQYPDGLRGPLIVHDPESPYAGKFDEEVVLTISDWYHTQMPVLLKSFISVTNPTGAEPIPDANLMNDSQNVTFQIQPGKTYMFRIINVGAFVSQYFWIEGHTMRIVEVDGVYTEPAEAEMLYISSAQRYSILVTARDDGNQNFPIVSSFDQTLLDTIPATLKPNVTGWLQYNKDAELPSAALVDEYNDFDDWTLVPYDRLPLFENVQQTVQMDVKMDNLGDGANYAFFNDITYVPPKVPTLYSSLTTGSLATNPKVYGVNSIPFVLAHNQVVEIVMNNFDTGRHPFHLHGHDFQAVARSPENGGVYDPRNATLARIPMRRDVFVVQPLGNFVLRFRSDNPGIWLFHCHIQWHTDSGLVATMIEAPLSLQQNLEIPQAHRDICYKSQTPMEGNAAGNTKRLLDLSGANVSPAPLPAGFTPSGIVALVFSALSACLGLAAITWYGVAPLSDAQEEGLASKRGREKIEGRATGDSSSTT
ncbi:MAG: hypothetical protein M1828_005087 [Chrysothrix sp. TS-e1954]|nr:MAG: hypothetical protein M1828_005087 [Chrysothrix sp. TS-e1954]